MSLVFFVCFSQAHATLTFTPYLLLTEGLFYCKPRGQDQPCPRYVLLKSTYSLSFLFFF